MNNKLSELSKPVAYDYQIAGACIADGHNENGQWVHWRNELSLECPPDWMIEEGQVKDLKPRYSQEYVSALLERVEAAERQSHERYVRIAELESKLVNAAQFITGLERHVKDIEATLIAATYEVSDLTKERDEARAKLATPVLLPNGIAQKIKVPGYYEAINEMMDCVRSAGFSMKGDE